MNADLGKYTLWPHKRGQLVDDLWALALANLPDLPDYEAAVNQQATLIGRTLEPWRPLLAVAEWLDAKGVTGLWARMEALSQSYQEERQELEPLNQTTLVIQAILYAWAVKPRRYSGEGRGWYSRRHRDQSG